MGKEEKEEERLKLQKQYKEEIAQEPACVLIKLGWFIAISTEKKGGEEKEEE